MPAPDVKLVAGLDLARRHDHSALVLLDVEPDRLTITAALRLPQAPLSQQFALIAPHLAGFDLLDFDQSGLGDVAARVVTGSIPLFVIIGAASGAMRQAMKALPASHSFAPTASPAEKIVTR